MWSFVWNVNTSDLRVWRSLKIPLYDLSKIVEAQSLQYYLVTYCSFANHILTRIFSKTILLQSMLENLFIFNFYYNIINWNSESIKICLPFDIIYCIVVTVILDSSLITPDRIVLIHKALDRCWWLVMLDISYVLLWSSK